MINISFSVSKIVPAVPKLQQVQRINATEKYLIAKVVFLRFCSRFFTTLIFATNQTLNATNAKITYLCNRFGHWGRLINKYLQTYINVRCTLHAQPCSLLQ